MKKTIMAAVVAAAVAMAVPSMALAIPQYTDKGVPISAGSDISIPLKGSFGFSGGINCKEFTATLTITSASTAEITVFKADNPETQCEVIGTLKALGCANLAGYVATGTPYTLDNQGTSVEITGVDIDHTLTGGAFCPKSLTMSGTYRATPNNPDSISSLVLSGELKSSVAGIATVISGTLSPVNASDIGTYGLT